MGRPRSALSVKYVLSIALKGLSTVKNVMLALVKGEIHSYLIFNYANNNVIVILLFKA
jgi:hypothetical protein